MLASPGTPALDVDITVSILMKKSLPREFLWLPNVHIVCDLSSLQLRNNATHEIWYPRRNVAIMKHNLIRSALRTNVMLKHQAIQRTLQHNKHYGQTNLYYSRTEHKALSQNRKNNIVLQTTNTQKFLTRKRLDQLFINSLLEFTHLAFLMLKQR